MPAGAQHFLDRPDGTADDAITLIVGQCGRCGLVQSEATPVTGYRRVITAAGLSAAMRAHRRTQVEGFAVRFGLSGAAVVEIGCGSGYLLDLLGEAGLRPQGTEWEGAGASPGAGWPIHHAYPEPGTPLCGAPFAGFFCLNFLEHAPDPCAFLQGISESLTPDGVGLIEVPNYAQQCRHGRVFDYVVDHLSYFEADTLATTLALGGFAVERVEETRTGENLEAWVRRRAPVALGAEAALIAETRAAVEAFLRDRRARGERLAIWGASHQALTLLAGVDASLLVGILDSAPFKQGRFAPVSRLPVLAPTNEVVGAFSCIVVIASGYEREILATLRGPLGFTGEVRTLQGREVRPLD